MGDPAFDERKFAVGVPICRTRVLADQSDAGAGLDVMRLPDGRLVQCVPAEYVLFTLLISACVCLQFSFFDFQEWSEGSVWVVVYAR